MRELKKIRITRAVNNLVADIRTHTFPVKMIVLYGSIARGEYNEYSDIDICIVTNEELAERQQLEIEQYIRAALGNELELDYIYCDYEKLSHGSRVFQSIRKEGVILYERH